MTGNTDWVILTVALLAVWPVHNIMLAVFAWWRPPTFGKHAKGFVPPGEMTEPLVFWIMVPALNEERVVGATVRAALELDSPETPLRVLVIDDGSDDGTPDVLAAIDDPRLHVLRRNPPNARQGKGEALNAAYRLIRDKMIEEGNSDRTIIGVIDGDGRGTPGMLLRIASHFGDPQVGGVQSQVRIHNRNKLLAFLQDMEFACIADASQSMRDVLGSVDLGGNGQFVRLRELMRFGDAPWSACLVEDLELGLRMHLNGAKIRYAKHATITQQGLVDVKRLVRQRARWGQGNLQCLRYVPKLIASKHINAFALIEFLYYILAPWLVAPLSLVVVGMIGLTTYGAVTGDTLGGMTATGGDLPLALSLWASALFTPGLLWGVVHRLRLKDEPLWRTLLVGLAYPGFLVLGMIATWRALGRNLAGRNAWAKTERLVEDTAAAILSDNTVKKGA